MKLADWLDAKPGRSVALAAHLGITPAAISHRRSSGSVPARHIAGIRAFTRGRVTVADLLPATTAKDAT